MKKKLFLTLITGVFIFGCTKQNASTIKTSETKAETLSAVLFPGVEIGATNFGLDYFFDNDYNVPQVLDGFKIIVPQIKEKSERKVYFTLKKYTDGYPQFEEENFCNTTFYEDGSAYLEGCKIDFSLSPTTLAGAIAVFLSIEGINKHYKISVYKREEFFAPIYGSYGYYTKDLDVNKIDLLNPNNQTSFPILKNDEFKKGINEKGIYNLVYEIFDQNTSNTQVGVYSKIDGAELYNSNEYKIALNLYGFTNAKQLTIRMYLVHNDDTNIASGFYKTIAIAPQIININ